jgi:hypothetical protein
MPWETWSPTGGGPAHRVRALIRAVMALHSTKSGEIWLWRGQSRIAFRLEPAMHSRVRITVPQVEFSEASVRAASRELIQAARADGLDAIEFLRLPDLALLAHLQHHGAATPLLDVTVDPFVALWMVAHANGDNISVDDEVDGALYAIRRPPPSRWLATLDSRPYWDSEGTDPDIATAVNRSGIHWYRAPDISERLRIQRGSFLIGPLADGGDVTLPLAWEAEGANVGWLGRRIDQVGQRGSPITAGTDVVRFRIPAGTKAVLRAFLDDRAGLTQSVIYPTPWHRPFLEEFCRGYGRQRPIDV